MVTLKQAVETLINSYGDIKAEAKTYQFGKSEILDELSKVNDDTAEGVVLNLLLESAIYDGEKVTKAKAPKVVADVSDDE
jgi:hypothetical protein